MKFLPMGVEFCHKDRLTNLAKLIVAICIVNAYKKKRNKTASTNHCRQSLLTTAARLFNRAIKGKTITAKLR